MVELGGFINSAADLPYVEAGVGLQGRAIHVLPYFDASRQEWFAFFPVAGKRFQRVALVDIVRGAYISSESLNTKDDYSLPLHNLVFQQMSFPKVGNPMMGLEDAIENTSSLLELFELVSVLHAADHPGASQLAQSLVSQLFVVSRSLYDSLQVFCRMIASYAKQSDALSKPLMKKLPTSFAEVALHSEEPRTADEISTRYDMPPPLASFYSDQAPFLASIRKIRDKVIHRGHHVGFVFNLDEGLAVPAAEAPWKYFDIWDEDLMAKNELGSLRLVFAHVIMQSVAATTRFAEAFFSCIALPEPISPSNQTFLRGPLNHHLINLQDILASPWERAETED